MSDESRTPTDLERLFRSAGELSGYEIGEGDVPVVATTPGGSLVKIPKRMIGRAEAEGITALGREEKGRVANKLRVQEEQAGIGSAVLAGTEQAFSTATFGLTDAAMMGLASLAGTSEEDYLRKREERQEGSPIASGIGTAVGLIAPALLTEGVSLAGAGTSTAAKVAARAGQAAGYAGVGGVMKVGRLAAEAAEVTAKELLPTVMSAGELGQAFKAARVAGATTAAPGIRAVAATALKTGAERAAAGMLEGALWGVGEGVRESILGKTDDVGEAIWSHAQADALLFATLGGGLGVLEGGLPWALNGARKATDLAYEKAPIFGRRALLEAAEKAPEKTGVAAETARMLYADRELAVQLDQRLNGALDRIAAATPERAQEILARMDEVVPVAQGQRDPLKMLSAIVAAPAEQAEAVLRNMPGVNDLMAASRTALPDLLSAPVETIGAVIGSADRVALLEARSPGSLRSLLAAPPEATQAVVANLDGLATLEASSPGALRKLLAAAPSDRAIAALYNAAPIAALENVRRGVLDAILEAPLERTLAAFRNPTGLLELERVVKNSTRQILQAEAGAAESLLANAGAVAGLELQASGTLSRLLDVEASRATLFAENAEGLRLLERSRRGAVRDLIENATDEEAAFFAGNSRAIAELEASAPGAIGVLRESSPEQAQWFLSRADDLAAMERELPGSMPGFRAFVSNGAWSQPEADALLDNWQAIMRNPNERARIVTDFIETKQKQLDAGERLAREAYTAAKGDRAEMLRAIGEPGGPPTLEGVQARLSAFADELGNTAAKMEGDAIRYDSKAIQEVRALAEQARADLAMPSQAAAAAGAPAGELTKYLRDPYEGFERLSVIRTEVGELVGALKSKPKQARLPSEARALAEASRLYAVASSAIKDASVFGEAATIRAELDSVVAKWRKMNGAKGTLRRKFLEIGQDEAGESVYKFSEPKFNQWINQIGDPRAIAKVIAGQSATTALHEMSSILNEMVDVSTRAVPSIARGTVDVGEGELRALIQRVNSSQTEIERRGLYSRIYNQTRLNLAEGTANTLGFRRGSVNLGGYGHGVPTAGTSGATVYPAATGTYAEAMAMREAGLSQAAAARETAAELETVQARERLAQLDMRERELARRSGMIVGGPAAAAEVEAGAAQALPGAEAFMASMAQRAASAVVPGGGAAVGALRFLTAVPRAQWQVASRVRGMVAIEKMGRQLADGIEEGARWLVGQATGKKIAVGAAFGELTRKKADPEADRQAREEARRSLAGESRAPRGRPPVAESVTPTATAAQDRMIREAHRLAADPTALAELLENQSSVLGRELPESTAAVSRVMARAAKTIARAAPVPEGQPLDEWQPSAADRAAFSRVMNASSRPLDLFVRAYDGTITQAEVDAVAEVAPGTLAKMRAAAQAHVEAARVENRPLSAQHRRGIETLLGYPLTTGSSRPSVAKYQKVYGAARAGRSERPSDGMVQPLPGAAKVSLGSRYMTQQQRASEREA